MGGRTFGTGAEHARAMVGYRYRCARPFVVEHRRIREFARAVQAFHPAYWQESAAAHLGFDQILAPPTFAASIWRQARREALEQLITGYHSDRIVHVDQTLDIGRPLLAGDVITCDVYIESFRQFKTFDVITVTGVLLDRHGNPVQTDSTALLARVDGTEHHRAGDSVTLTGPSESVPAIPASLRGSTRPACTRIDFDRLAVDTELPRAGATVTAADLANYARLAGDSPADTFLGHQLILGLAAGYLTSWTRDPAAVTKYRAEFANQVHYLAVSETEAAEIEFGGRVIAVDHRHRTATVAIEAKSRGRRLFGYSSAEVAFAPVVPARW
ncbi:FAS1-like dehydratase domain-containing protein [Nocardia niigatensis]|uniref:FAS1-like dehydratase domain-containing protein n=1 Tax=Nocardia niigatensis TaxID=209249 RepID=UPI0002FD5460|nr:MaoC family dehydratase N-terminal domain-containing protein [Nocardia niigatensis]